MSILLSCQRAQDEPAAVTVFEEPKTILNHSYGVDPRQKMDVYLPADRSAATTNTIILIHGGGWNSGNKSDFAAYIDSFQKRMPDWAIINLNYRLFSGGHRFPAQEEDVNSAIQYISKQAEAWGIDRNKFSLLGASAGAHLALLQAYKQQAPRIRAVIDFFGPTDLTLMYRQPWHPYVTMALQMVTGTTPDINEELYTASSPVNFISTSSPPTLLLHGSADPVVDLSQSKWLKKKLDEKGIPNELVVYPGGGHGWYGKNLVHSFDRIEAFLLQHLATTKN